MCFILLHNNRMSIDKWTTQILFLSDIHAIYRDVAEEEEDFEVNVGKAKKCFTIIKDCS